MLLTLNIAPGMLFATTSSAIGMTDQDAHAMKGDPLRYPATGFIWCQVRDAGDRLLNAEPQGSC